MFKAHILRPTLSAGGLLLGLALWAGLRLVAAQAPPEGIRTGRLEIVDAAGRIVARLEAHAEGGRLQLWSRTGALGLTAVARPAGGGLEVLDAEERVRFSAGMPREAAVPLWERQQHQVERLQQQLARQQQDVQRLQRLVASLEGRQPDARQRLELDRLQRDLEQLARSVQGLRRDLEHLERLVRTLERR
ncbi:MAG: hypothetical protein KatS3mg131_3619 [Candidatus Tectimicrobiota bacterium]|nr:MAG: hypothetical protein KatS3mg131_3619 [Candidatus Tectomicrobia bacterium]